MTTLKVQADNQIRAAHEAFLGAREVDLETRASWLTATADALADSSGELVRLAEEVTHLDQQRLTLELMRTVFQLKLLAGETLSGEHIEATIDHQDVAWGMGPRPDIRRMNIPLGVVGVFGASNFNTVQLSVLALL